MKPAFTLIDGHYAIVRLAADDAIPPWAHGAFLSITRTPHELSIVCNEGNVPDVLADRGWRCLELAGPLPLDQTGVAAAFTGVLAEAGIALFVIATYDTDYVLVRDASLERHGRVARGGIHGPLRAMIAGPMERSLAVPAPPPTRERFVLHRAAASPSNSFADDVRLGLTATPKFLLPHYFYDALGSALFSAICELPEYYVTRAEDEILRSRATEIATAFGPNVRLVELGSGSARKTRHLIEAILARQASLDFFPVDVDGGILESSGQALLNDYPRLSISAICGDFRSPATLLRPYLPPSDARTIVLFLGSSIGNLDPAGAGAMLSNLRTALTPGDALFLGADLRKAPSILEPAYDDALGVTAAFNLNLLARINRELGGTFDLSSFAHRANYNEAKGRVEMHLVSKKAQRVLIDGYDVAFEEGESIHTENSHKYDDASLNTLAEAGRFTIEQRWTDSRGYFADLLMTAG